MDKTTYCINCKHRKQSDLASPAFDECLKNPRVNFVNGEIDNWSCGMKNNGQCPDYEEKSK